jgi:hypothetical protein
MNKSACIPSVPQRKDVNCWLFLEYDIARMYYVTQKNILHITYIVPDTASYIRG